MGLNNVLILVLLSLNYARPDEESLGTNDLGDVDYIDDNEMYSYNQQLPDDVALPYISERRVILNMYENQTIENQAFAFADKSSRLVASNCSLLLITGHDLYAFNVSADRSTATFQEVGVLDDIGDDHIVDVQFISRDQFILLLVAVDSRYQVYVTASNKSNGSIRPVEKISVIGQHQRSILFAQGDTVYALIGNGVPSELGATSTVRLFKWRQSHFTMLSQHSVHWMQDVHFCESSDGGTVFVVVQPDQGSDSITLLEVFLFGHDRWRHVQNLNVNSARIYTFNMDKHCFLMSMPSENGSPAEKYVWDLDNFRLVTDHPLVTFDHLVSNNNDLVVILNRNQLTAFPEADFKQEYTVDSDHFIDSNELVLIDSDGGMLVGIIKANQNNSHIEYLIELVGIQIEHVQADHGEVKITAVENSIISCYKDLEKSVAERKTIIEKLRDSVSSVMRKDLPFSSSAVFTTNSSAMTSGAFLDIRTNVSSNATTPANLMQRIQQLKARLDRLNSIRPTRLRRDLINPIFSERKSVIVKRLIINRPNIFSNVLRRTKEMHIKVPITANALIVNSIKLLQSNETVSRASDDTNRHLEANAIKHVNKFNVKTINGIDWDTFADSVYRKSTPLPIKGTLIVTKPSYVEKLSCKTLNGLPVDTFVTLQTDQVIESNVQLARFLSIGINANLTNGVRFGNDVVTVQGDKIIESPVIIDKCSVDLLSLSGRDGSEFSRHVVGTQLEDLSQIYTGKVIIRGSLRLHNVIVDRPKVIPSVNVNGHKFELDIQLRYWMKSTDQIFGSKRFVSPTFLPQIRTDLINQHLVSEYLLRTSNPPQDVNLILHSAAVLGNVYTDPSFRTTLSTISEECVRRLDTAIIQNGRKLFTGSLVADSLYTAIGPNNYVELNGLLRDKLITPRKKIVFPCTKQFKQLSVLGSVHVTSDHFNIAVLNGLDLIGEIQNMARTTAAATLDEVVFAGNVNTVSLAVELVEETAFIGVLDQIESLVGNRGSIGSVQISGDVTFEGNLVVKTINQINLDDYLNLIVTKSSNRVPILGVKKFSGDVQIGALLNVQNVNEWCISYLIENAMHRRRSQTIPSTWTIGAVQIQQLWTPSINEVITEHLIDSGIPNANIESNFAVDTLQVDLNVLAAQTNCDIPTVISTINDGIQKKYWAFIDVDGTATWPGDNLTTPINRLFAFAVADSFDQIITGKTTFNKPTNIHVMSSNVPFNGVNLVHLASDALLTSSGFQTMSGNYIFRNRLTTGPITAQQNLQASIYNSCDLYELNRTIFRNRIDNTISGTKVFRVAPTILHIQIEGLVNGLSTTDLVSLDSPNILPPVTIQTEMFIEMNLNITKTLNYIPFDYFLLNRLRIFGPVQEIQGTLSFQHLIIKNSARLVSINAIPIEDVVISSSDAEQEVTGQKTIFGTLTLEGPAVMQHVNGFDLVQAFTNSIGTDRNVNIDTLDVKNNITLNKGIVVQKNMHGVDVMSVLYGQPPNAEDVQPIQKEILREIRRVETLLHQSQSNASDVYLDYAADVKIKYAKHPSPELFIVDTSVPCDQCQCPVQNFVSVMQYQVNVFRQQLFERVIRLKWRNLNGTIYTKFKRSSKCVGLSTEASNQSKSVVEWLDLDQEQRTFTVSESDFIREARTFEQEQTSLLLVCQQNRTVDVFQINAHLSEWTKLEPLDGGRPIEQMFVLSWESYNILLVTTGPLKDSVHGNAQMYYFDGSTFKPLYGAISGDFDQCAYVHLERRHMLIVWLGRTGTDVITVFTAVNDGGTLRKFDMLQSIIVPDGMLRTMVPICVQDTNYMAVVTQNSFLYLYKFNYLEGWIQASFGYFKDIETVVPFRYYERNYLYVSMKMAATALIVHQRG